MVLCLLSQVCDAEDVDLASCVVYTLSMYPSYTPLLPYIFLQQLLSWLFWGQSFHPEEKIKFLPIPLLLSVNGKGRRGGGPVHGMRLQGVQARGHSGVVCRLLGGNDSAVTTLMAV